MFKARAPASLGPNYYTQAAFNGLNRGLNSETYIHIHKRVTQKTPVVVMVST
jgi:hypothetical protein